MGSRFVAILVLADSIFMHTKPWSKGTLGFKYCTRPRTQVLDYVKRLDAAPRQHVMSVACMLTQEEWLALSAAGTDPSHTKKRSSW